ncbi:hypothetical protein GTZ97_14940 [Aquabacterium fontiphilum]|uniref:hypothetical protein n=1 Tax=Aquabacterium fontiphilum TaxID=450365 RepID=UPI001378F1A1|nr:hypothetical protein [Aquabacterium fontiphilum]NBD21955.1 hypothetical protein [Aquabacterium fontiphilum]
MLTGSVLALFWVLLALIGALGGLVFIAGLRGAGLALVVAVLASVTSTDTIASTTWVRETGWVLQPNGSGVYEVLPQDGRGGQHTTTCTTTSCQRTGSVAGPLGNPKPTLAPTATFDKAALARGAVNLGTRALPWLTLGYGLYDWYTSAGIQQSGDVVTGAEPYSPAVLGSGTWTFEEAPNKTLGYGTRDAACVAYNSWRSTVGLIVLSGIYARQSNGGWVCTGTFPDGAISWTAAILEQLPSTRCPFGSANSEGQCPYNAQQQPIDLQDAISRLIDAPITAQQLKLALEEILAAGGSLQSTGTSVTGPSSAPGPQRTTTTTSPNGTQTVTTYNTTYNYTYNNTTIKVTASETKTSPDGSTETTTDDSPDPQPSPTADPPMPDVPSLYQQRYPDGLAGVWNTNKSALMQSPLFSFLGTLVPGFSDGGCPVWSIPVMYGIHDFREVDVSLPCWLWSSIRAIMVVSTLLLCRRLIFGG